MMTLQYLRSAPAFSIWESRDKVLLKLLLKEEVATVCGFVVLQKSCESGLLDGHKGA